MAGAASLASWDAGSPFVWHLADIVEGLRYQVIDAALDPMGDELDMDELGLVYLVHAWLVTGALKGDLRQLRERFDGHITSRVATGDRVAPVLADIRNRLAFADKEHETPAPMRRSA